MSQKKKIPASIKRIDKKLSSLTFRASDRDAMQELRAKLRQEKKKAGFKGKTPGEEALMQKAVKASKSKIYRVNKELSGLRMSKANAPERRRLENEIKRLKKECGIKEISPTEKDRLRKDRQRIKSALKRATDPAYIKKLNSSLKDTEKALGVKKKRVITPVPEIEDEITPEEEEIEIEEVSGPWPEPSWDEADFVKNGWQLTVKRPVLPYELAPSLDQMYESGEVDEVQFGRKDTFYWQMDRAPIADLFEYWLYYKTEYEMGTLANTPGFLLYINPIHRTAVIFGTNELP